MNRKYLHPGVTPKNQKVNNPKMTEILKDCLWVHENHQKKSDKAAGFYELSLKIMNHYMEYAIYEFSDLKSDQKVELVIYYRFSSLCMVHLLS